MNNIDENMKVNLKQENEGELVLSFNGDEDEEVGAKSYTFSRRDSMLRGIDLDKDQGMEPEDAKNNVEPLKIRIIKPNPNIKIDKKSFRVEESRLHKKPVSRTLLSQ